MPSTKPSARSRLTHALADEILNHSSEASFAIASEHQLCRRFQVSRVTVRLALSELEAKGLIFRRHGKGTFAYGRLNKVRRSIGVLLKTFPSGQQWPFTEMLRGIYDRAAALRSNVLLIHASPQEWSTEMRKELAGVVLFPTGFTQVDMECIEQSKMPFLLAWEGSFTGPHLDFGQKAAARIVAERLLLAGHERLALVTGFEPSLDELKRQGVQEALKSVGLGPKAMTEYAVTDQNRNLEEIAGQLLCHQPRLTAVITTDESSARVLIDYLHRHTTVRVPDGLSVASFHRSPFHDQYPALASVDFDFFRGGSCAADALNQAFLTGVSLKNIKLTTEMIEGATIGPSCFSRE